MKTATKKEGIKNRALEILRESYKDAELKIDKAINSGALDIENWSHDYNSMILPKIIVIAILEDEANQYKAKGTSFEKEVKRESNNLKHFL